MKYYQIPNNSAAKSRQIIPAAAGTFEIGPFPYILMALIMRNKIQGCPCH